MVVSDMFGHCLIALCLTVEQAYQLCVRALTQKSNVDRPELYDLNATRRDLLQVKCEQLATQPVSAKPVTVYGIGRYF